MQQLYHENFLPKEAIDDVRYDKCNTLHAEKPVEHLHRSSLFVLSLLLRVLSFLSFSRHPAVAVTSQIQFSLHLQRPLSAASVLS